MRHEIEVKLEVRNPRALKRRMGELGFRAFRPRRLESNRLYDFTDRRLRKAGWVLRLRFVDGRCLLTLKCGPVASRSYKVRREVETRIEDGKRLSEILQRLGMRESFRYEKYRTVYGRQEPARSQGALAYDETPVGNYLELEGPKRWIDRVARELGYQPEDYVTIGYPALYSMRRRAGGRLRGNLVSRVREARC